MTDPTITEAREALREWRCFHCDEVFTDKESAQAHFGDSEFEFSGCRLNGMEGGLLALYREAQNELRRFRGEDSDSYRAFYALGADHSQALRREEEKGYERGLRDARAALASPPGEVGTTPELDGGDIVERLRNHPTKMQAFRPLLDEAAALLDQKAKREKELVDILKRIVGSLTTVKGTEMDAVLGPEYRLHGEFHTFWLFTTPDGRAIKGEGKTDAEALEQVREALATPTPRATSGSIHDDMIFDAIELQGRQPDALEAGLVQLARLPANQGTQSAGPPTPTPELDGGDIVSDLNIIANHQWDTVLCHHISQQLAFASDTARKAAALLDQKAKREMEIEKGIDACDTVMDGDGFQWIKARDVYEVIRRARLAVPNSRAEE